MSSRYRWAWISCISRSVTRTLVNVLGAEVRPNDNSSSGSRDLVDKTENSAMAGFNRNLEIDIYLHVYQGEDVARKTSSRVHARTPSWHVPQSSTCQAIRNLTCRIALALLLFLRTMKGGSLSQFFFCSCSDSGSRPVVIDSSDLRTCIGSLWRQNEKWIQSRSGRALPSSCPSFAKSFCIRTCLDQSERTWTGGGWQVGRMKDIAVKQEGPQCGFWSCTRA